jgi:hypothetical protein
LLLSPDKQGKETIMMKRYGMTGCIINKKGKNYPFHRTVFAANVKLAKEECKKWAAERGRLASLNFHTIWERGKRHVPNKNKELLLMAPKDGTPMEVTAPRKITLDGEAYIHLGDLVSVLRIGRERRHDG